MTTDLHMKLSPDLIMIIVIKAEILFKISIMSL